MSSEEYQTYFLQLLYIDYYITISKKDRVISWSFCWLSLRSLRRIFAEMILWSEDTPSKEGYASQFKELFIHFLLIKV